MTFKMSREVILLLIPNPINPEAPNKEVGMRYFFCLSNKEAIRVPCSSTDRESLLKAGLGEKKVLIPHISCSPEEFNKVIQSAFPKMHGCGGFDLLRCIQNTKDLDVISAENSQSPKLLNVARPI